LTVISFLHLDPRPGEIDSNRALIEAGIKLSAENDAKWIITPELAVSGYYFKDVIGTEWIGRQPDEWLNRMAQLAKDRAMNLFICCPELGSDHKLYNSVFAIDSIGRIAGKYSKTRVHPGTETDWSTPGNTNEPVTIDGFRVGLLICADIYQADLMLALKEKGARLVICPAAWGTERYPPGDLWERRTAESGLPLWVCNRTGREKDVIWYGGQSVVAKDGNRLLAESSPSSAAILFDWDFQSMTLTQAKIAVLPIMG